MATVEQSYEPQTRSIYPNGNVRSAEVEYIVRDAADEAAALEAVRLVASAHVGALALASLSIGGRPSDAVWLVNASYEGSDNGTSDDALTADEMESEAAQDRLDDEATPTISFSNGGGTMHMDYSYQQTPLYFAQGHSLADTNPRLGIGWNGRYGDDYQVSGVDIPCASIRFSLSRIIRYRRLTTAYLRSTSILVGKVNNAPFWGWSAGEVMYLNMSFQGKLSGNERIVVTYDFAVQPNESNVTIPGAVGTYSKKGWTYVDAITEPTADGAMIRAVFAHRVVNYANFGILGLKA